MNKWNIILIETKHKQPFQENDNIAEKQKYTEVNNVKKMNNMNESVINEIDSRAKYKFRFGTVLYTLFWIP